MTQLICALQGDSSQKAKKTYNATAGWIDVYKIGIDLFTHSGTQLVNNLIRKGEKIFLDLKFCDIPTVVARAVETCARLKVAMFTIHIMGGPEMMKLCVEHLADFCAKKHIKPRPLVLGVTILTSISEPEYASIFPIKEQIKLSAQINHLAYLAKKSGVDGVVCSVHEVASIKKECGKNFLTVVPGIRVTLPESEIIAERKKLKNQDERARLLHEDQQRFDSPEAAARAGADYIVVGRPIIRAFDPVAVIEKIRHELKQGSK
ncbi:MAG: orotidine-5'-phosphate decarboxylase [Candidatus Latescibacteria bacterium]|nr:orotidine-5'-phosphate decarboxylase [Candidatus Latescibacterota bacterium]